MFLLIPETCFKQKAVFTLRHKLIENSDILCEKYVHDLAFKWCCFLLDILECGLIT
jgi:hypothetical protein